MCFILFFLTILITTLSFCLLLIWCKNLWMNWLLSRIFSIEIDIFLLQCMNNTSSLICIWLIKAISCLNCEILFWRRFGGIVFYLIILKVINLSYWVNSYLRFANRFRIAPTPYILIFKIITNWKFWNNYTFSSFIIQKLCSLWVESFFFSICISFRRYFLNL